MTILLKKADDFSHIHVFQCLIVTITINAAVYVFRIQEIEILLILLDAAVKSVRLITCSQTGGTLL